jgi:phosphoglycerate dehydrogenase-like enzyme
VVIGVGGIGTQIAIRTKAFGLEVIGVDLQDEPLVPFLKSVVKKDQLDDVLPKWTWSSSPRHTLPRLTR